MASYATSPPFLTLVGDVLLKVLESEERLLAVRASELLPGRVRPHVHVEISLRIKLPVAGITIEGVLFLVEGHVGVLVLLVVALVADLADEHLPRRFLVLLLGVVVVRRSGDAVTDGCLDLARFDRFVHSLVEAHRFVRGEVGVALDADVRAGMRGCVRWGFLLVLVRLHVGAEGASVREERRTYRALVLLWFRIRGRRAGVLVVAGDLRELDLAVLGEKSNGESTFKKYKCKWCNTTKIAKYFITYLYSATGNKVNFNKKD